MSHIFYFIMPYTWSIFDSFGSYCVLESYYLITDIVTLMAVSACVVVL